MSKRNCVFDEKEKVARFVSINSIEANSLSRSISIIWINYSSSFISIFLRYWSVFSHLLSFSIKWENGTLSIDCVIGHSCICTVTNTKRVVSAQFLFDEELQVKAHRLQMTVRWKWHRLSSQMKMICRANQRITGKSKKTAARIRASTCNFVLSARSCVLRWHWRKTRRKLESVFVFCSALPLNVEGRRVRPNFSFQVAVVLLKILLRRIQRASSISDSLICYVTARRTLILAKLKKDHRSFCRWRRQIQLSSKIDSNHLVKNEKKKKKSDGRRKFDFFSSIRHFGIKFELFCRWENQTFDDYRLISAQQNETFSIFCSWTFN